MKRPANLDAEGEKLWPDDRTGVTHLVLRESFLARLIPSAQDTLRGAADIVASSMISEAKHDAPRLDNIEIGLGVVRDLYHAAAALIEIIEVPKHSSFDPLNSRAAAAADGFPRQIVALANTLREELEAARKPREGDD